MRLENGFFGLYKGEEKYLCSKNFLSDDLKTDITEKEIKKIIVDKLTLILGGDI